MHGIGFKSHFKKVIYIIILKCFSISAYKEPIRIAIKEKLVASEIMPNVKEKFTKVCGQNRHYNTTGE